MGGFWVVLWWAGASIFPWQAEAPTCSTPVPIYAFIVFFGAGKVSVFSHFYRSRKTNGQIDVFEKSPKLLFRSSNTERNLYSVWVLFVLFCLETNAKYYYVIVIITIVIIILLPGCITAVATGVSPIGK